MQDNVTSFTANTVQKWLSTWLSYFPDCNPVQQPCGMPEQADPWRPGGLSGSPQDTLEVRCPCLQLTEQSLFMPGLHITAEDAWQYVIQSTRSTEHFLGKYVSAKPQIISKYMMFLYFASLCLSFRFLKKMVVCLEIPVLVKTIMDADGLTSVFCTAQTARNFLKPLKETPGFIATQTAGNILRCPQRYPVVWLELWFAVWQLWL